MAISRSAARGIAWLVTVGLAAAFAIFIWPTSYFYDRMQMLGETTPGPVYPVRINRFTGHAEILMPQMLLDSRHSMKLHWVGGPGDPLPSDALALLKRDLVLETEPLPFVQIMNSTDWMITQLRWDVSTSAQDGTRLTRQLDQTVFIEPRTVASLHLELGQFARGATIVLQNAWGDR
jgi:hypothetical protein